MTGVQTCALPILGSPSPCGPWCHTVSRGLGQCDVDVPWGKFTVLSELAGEGGGLLLGRRVVVQGLLSLLLVLLVIGTVIRLLLVV